MSVTSFAVSSRASSRGRSASDGSRRCSRSRSWSPSRHVDEDCLEEHSLQGFCQ